MKLEKISIEELKPATYNPRKKLKPSDKEYQKIKRSIEEFGYVDPIIANKDLTIIGGHQRMNVMKDMGFKEVDVVIIDVDKNKEKALNVALNKITGEWDYGKLGDLLLELDAENYDLAITGFEDFEIESIMAPISDLDSFVDENDLDDDRTKTKVQISITYNSYEDFEKNKERYEEIANASGGNVSIKMV